MTFEAPGAPASENPSTVTFQIEPHHDLVRLTVTHEHLNADELRNVGTGLAADLESRLETGCAAKGGTVRGHQAGH